MQLYVIRRRSAFADKADLEAGAGRSAKVGNEEMSDQVRWIRSYVVEESDGRVGTVCIYQAVDVAAIREHARRADIAADEIVPDRKAARYGRCSGYDAWKTTSRPASIARFVAVAVLASVRCSTTAPPTADWSEMTKPRNPQSRRSVTSRSARRCVAGIPSTELYAVITDLAPASSAARNGGKWSSSSPRLLVWIG